jgi:hypothetical protein
MTSKCRTCKTTLLENKIGNRKEFRRWALKGGSPDKGGDKEIFQNVSDCNDIFFGNDAKCNWDEVRVVKTRPPTLFEQHEQNKKKKKDKKKKKKKTQKKQEREYEDRVDDEDDEYILPSNKDLIVYPNGIKSRSRTKSPLLQIMNIGKVARRKKSKNALVLHKKGSSRSRSPLLVTNILGKGARRKKSKNALVLHKKGKKDIQLVVSKLVPRQVKRSSCNIGKSKQLTKTGKLRCMLDKRSESSIKRKRQSNRRKYKLGLCSSGKSKQRDRNGKLRCMYEY